MSNLLPDIFNNWFGAYLGGIETTSRWWDGDYDPGFGAYLGGIETGGHDIWKHDRKPVWSLPRRD